LLVLRQKGAKIAVPDLIDLSEVIDNSPDEMVRIVLEANQKMMLKIALHMARKDYEQRATKQASGIEAAKAKGVYKGRKPDTVANAKIVELRKLDYTIAKIATTLNVSESQVKLILKKAKEAEAA
jgi:DNA invertase Pin-like site-specific DNA recombinase